MDEDCNCEQALDLQEQVMQWQERWATAQKHLTKYMDLMFDLTDTVKMQKRTIEKQNKTIQELMNERS